jgi:ethanolamine permease
LLDGFRVILGSDRELIAALLGLAAISGLIASFHTIIFAYGRNIFSLSRAGYFPKWMSVTHGSRKTPWLALVLGALIGYGLAVALYLVDPAATGELGGALLRAAVFGGVISYAMQCLSFVVLRRKMPDIERPYRSPVGIAGAVVAGLIALAALAATLVNEDYRLAVYGVAVWFVLGLLYFGLSGRNKLVLSPEEEFAMTRGEHGHPEVEGYGHTMVADTTTDAAAADAPDVTGPAT